MRLGLFKCHSGITVTLAYTFRKSVLTCDVILPVSQLPTVLGVGKRHPLISNVTLGLAPELTKRLLSFVFFLQQLRWQTPSFGRGSLIFISAAQQLCGFPVPLPLMLRIPCLVILFTSLLSLFIPSLPLVAFCYHFILAI